MEAEKKMVLIVDDSPIIIERLKSMLTGVENVGTVIYASTYSRAILLLAENNPDIAVLDINLPDKNGIEILRYIKKNHVAITVIMLTNQAADYYRNLCKLLGAEYFLDKSTEFEKVPAIISSLA